jgi:AMIN domain-containing protein
MPNVSRYSASRLLAVPLFACLIVGTSPGQVSVRSVKVLGTKDTVEIEVEASDRIVPQTQVLAGPDRLVIDFPNALPSAQLHSQSIDRGEVKDVRVGLFQAKPPITRLVLDLKTAQSFEIFPSGRTIMIKVTGGTEEAQSADYSPAANRPGYVPASYTTGGQPVRIVNTVRPPLEVSYRDGLLGIVANKATLSEVLYAVQQRTGADISVPAGAEQERVVAEIEPAPAPEVLARLLNGSRFNFLILSAANDTRQLDRVILSPRMDPGYMPLPQMQAQNFPAQSNDVVAEDDPAPVPTQANIVTEPPPPPPALPAAQGKVQADEASPEQ